MNKKWLVWLQVTIEEDAYKSKNTCMYPVCILYVICLNWVYDFYHLNVQTVSEYFQCIRAFVLWNQIDLFSDTIKRIHNAMQII